MATVNNITSSAQVSCMFNMADFLTIPGIKYHPEKFPGASLKCQKGTLLIFSSGKIVCVGCKTPADAYSTIEQFVESIKHLGYRCVIKNFRISNYVASYNVKCALNLVKLRNNYASQALLEPEIFPGLLFKVSKPKISVLVFATGRIVLTGAKTQQDLSKGFKYILPILLKHKLE